MSPIASTKLIVNISDNIPTTKPTCAKMKNALAKPDSFLVKVLVNMRVLESCLMLDRVTGETGGAVFGGVAGIG